MSELLQISGFESYRADQLFKNVYQNSFSLDDRYIPKSVLQFVKDNLTVSLAGRVEKDSLSKIDGTRKMLIELDSPKYKVECKKKH